MKRVNAQPGSKTEQWHRIWLRFAFVWRRACLHIRTLVPTCVGGLEWWWLRHHFGRQFIIFLGVSVLFDLGEFIFFLLYNLYLLDLHYTESFLGQISAAVTAGTFLAILPAAALARRLGLRNAVLIAIVGTATATSLRAILPWRSALLVGAFFNGSFMSFWAVSLPPAVSGLTTKANRTLGFSLITSMGIGIGGVAGLIGGRLPGALMHFNSTLAPAQAKQIALLVGSGLAALALFPALLLVFRTNQIAKPSDKTYPRSRFVYSFLIALFVWSIGTGGFNPFFNAYFSRHSHMSVEAIGFVFSYGQLAQVFVILLAPAVVNKIGQAWGILSMQVATAVMLALLAVVVTPSVAALLYVAYMCFQYMSEPCLLSMLMSQVAVTEQSGASALNFMVMALAGMIAAVAAGATLSHFGYGATLTGCALITAFAAGLFYLCLRPGTPK